VRSISFPYPIPSLARQSVPNLLVQPGEQTGRFARLNSDTAAVSCGRGIPKATAAQFFGALAGR
jgi:hypothetical protein